jgi:hypothetical protein
MFDAIFSFFISTAHAQTTAPQFVSLTNIPGLTELSSTAPLPDLLRNLFLVTIGFAAILGVIMIAIGGAEYMLSDKMGTISKGRSRMQSALLGLGIILASYLILNTINPDLLKINILLPAADPTHVATTPFVYFTVPDAVVTDPNIANICDRLHGEWLPIGGDRWQCQAIL